MTHPAKCGNASVYSMSC